MAEHIVEENHIARELAHHFSGPLVFDYVWWVLTESQRRNIKTLYFLARDGYVLREIAELFSKHFNLNIDCRYLYCSRVALRTPSYHLLSTNEIYHLLLLGGYQVTLKSLLQRAGLNDDECSLVYSECGFDRNTENTLLTRTELAAVKEKIKHSKIYYSLIMEKSKEAYKNAIGYFEQEGLLGSSQIAIVDSGWTGSMQRSLRQLLRSAGYRGSFIGFYFGMYQEPKDSEDGTYLTYFFNWQKNIPQKICFCNNLFECILSAPHGMTIGYEKNGRNYEPKLLPPRPEHEQSIIVKQIEEICEYAKSKVKEVTFGQFDETKAKKTAFALIRRYMAHPRKEEALFYGGIQFCDDITEAYHCTLASETQLSALKGYSIPKRILRRLRKSHSDVVLPELFWPYGTMAFLPQWKQIWYRLNVYTWELLRYVMR